MINPFKKIGETRNVVYNYQPVRDGVVAIIGDSNRSHLQVFNTYLEVERSISDLTAYDFVDSIENILFTTLDADASYLLNKTTLEYKRLPYILHIKGFQIGDQYLCFGEKDGIECYLQISLRTFEILNKYDTNIGFGNIQNWLGSEFTSTETRKGILGYFDFQNNLKWQLDLSQSCAYDLGKGLQKAEISNIYINDKSIFILAGLSVVGVSIKTGDILWNTKLDTWQSRAVINASYLYTTSNTYLNKIDCETGEIIYKNKEFEGTGPVSELIWNDGFLWTIMDSSPSTLLCIDPKTGNYVETISLPDLGITRDCYDPKFYENRMYLLDHDNTLHVFENKLK